MCTVTVIPTFAGPRLVHSRDEQRSRALASPPVSQQLPSGRRAVWPTDPHGGGTWIAARADGLVLALLNRNIPDNGRPPPDRSRGGLIPRLIDASDAADVMGALASHDLVGTAPFRLLALDPDGTARLATWDGLALEPIVILTPPFCLASSGIGDDRVYPRIPLFATMVAADPSPEAQDAFHRHRWDDAPEISVLMSRPDARTVSITAVLPAEGGAGGGGGGMEIEILPEFDPWCDPVGAAGRPRG